MVHLNQVCLNHVCILVAGLLATNAFIGVDSAWRRHVIDDGSRGADGIRVADVNRDGFPDLVTGWEQGGAVRACLNPGRADVTKKWPTVVVGRAADVEDAVFCDLDSDGAMDVVSCAEGKTRAILFHWGPRAGDQFLNTHAWHTEKLPASANRMMWMYSLPMHVDDQHGIDLIAGGKGENAEIGWFESPSDARQLEQWKWHPLRPVGWLMSLMSSDMDGDGDPDIVFSDRKQQRRGCYWLENPGKTVACSSPWPEHPIGGVGEEVMFLQLADLDQDGLEDLVAATQPKQILWLRRRDRTGQSWQPHSIPLPDNTGIAKAVQVADLDGDARLDLVFSCERAEAPRHGLMWLSSDGPPHAGPWTAHPLSGVDGVKHDLIAALDLDGDGDLDVITTEEVRQLGVIWYENPMLNR